MPLVAIRQPDKERLERLARQERRKMVEVLAKALEVYEKSTEHSKIAKR